MRDGFGRRFARIDFDRIFAFGIGQQREVLARCGHQFRHFIVRQEGGRAAAPMQLRHGAPRVETRRLQSHFALQPLDIGTRMRAVFRRDLVAAAVEAHGVAKGNVEVQREIGGRGAWIGGGAQIVGGIELVAELQGGWIGRIPWTVRAVFGEQIGAK